MDLEWTDEGVSVEWNGHRQLGREFQEDFVASSQGIPTGPHHPHCSSKESQIQTFHCDVLNPVLETQECRGITKTPVVVLSPYRGQGRARPKRMYGIF